jgi:hypothetical protein
VTEREAEGSDHPAEAGMAVVEDQRAETAMLVPGVPHPAQQARTDLGTMGVESRAGENRGGDPVGMAGTDLDRDLRADGAAQQPDRGNAQRLQPFGRGVGHGRRTQHADAAGAFRRNPADRAGAGSAARRAAPPAAASCCRPCPAPWISSTGGRSPGASDTWPKILWWAVRVEQPRIEAAFSARDQPPTMLPPFGCRI